VRGVGGVAPAGEGVESHLAPELRLEPALQAWEDGFTHSTPLISIPPVFVGHRLVSCDSSDVLTSLMRYLRISHNLLPLAICPRMMSAFALADTFQDLAFSSFRPTMKQK
jgi:hypothetical protein